MKAYFCVILLCFAQPVFGQGQAEWQLVVNPGGCMSGTCTILAPVGTAPVILGAIFGYPDAIRDTNIQPISIRQDSIQGDGFTPETGGKTVDFYQGNYVSQYNFNYTPSDDDTSIVLISCSSKAPPYNQQVEVIGITYIAASNEYSLSRSDFGSLPANDTATALLKIFNHTPDSELVTFSFENGFDFSTLDSISLPILLAPGDSLPALRVSYRSSSLRPVSRDSLHLTVQRIRDGANYRTPLPFGDSLIGRCNIASYYTLSKSKFGYIATNDSSVGFIRLYNFTADTEEVSLDISPQPDFRIDQGVATPVQLLPYDSIDTIRISMHASINRKAIRDTLTLVFHWLLNGVETTGVTFLEPITGGCSDIRFSLDSSRGHIYTSVGKPVYCHATVRNLSESTIYINRGLEATDYSGIDFFSIDGSSTIEVPPLGSALDSILFAPLQPGVWEAQFVLKDNFDSAKVDRDSEIFDGIATPSDAVSQSFDESLSIYPNPSTNEFRIQRMKIGSFFVIYNALGIPIFQSRKDQFVWDGRDDFGNLCRSGHYFAVVNGPGHRDVVPILLIR